MTTPNEPVLPGDDHERPLTDAEMDAALLKLAQKAIGLQDFLGSADSSINVYKIGDTVVITNSKNKNQQ